MRAVGCRHDGTLLLDECGLDPGAGEDILHPGGRETDALGDGATRQPFSSQLADASVPASASGYSRHPYSLCSVLNGPTGRHRTRNMDDYVRGDKGHPDLHGAGWWGPHSRGSAGTARPQWARCPRDRCPSRSSASWRHVLQGHGDGPGDRPALPADHRQPAGPDRPALRAVFDRNLARHGHLMALVAALPAMVRPPLP